MKIFCAALMLLTVVLSNKSEAQWNGYVYRPYNYYSLYPIYQRPPLYLPYYGNNYNGSYRNYTVPVYPRFNYVSPRGDGRGYYYQVPVYPRFGR